MIKDLTFEQEKVLANELYYGGGVTRKYSDGGLASVFSAGGEDPTFFKGNYRDMMKNYDPNDPNSVMPTRDDMSTLRKGTSWKGESTGSMVSAGAGAASQLIGAFDKDPGYGNADVAQETLKYAAMGAQAGPIGAAVGTAVGLGVGLVKKGKYKKEKKKAEQKEEREKNLQEFLSVKSQDYAGYQDGGKIPIDSLVDLKSSTTPPKNRLDSVIEGSAMKAVKDFRAGEAKTHFKNMYGDDYVDSLMSKYGSLPPSMKKPEEKIKPEVMQAAIKKLESSNYMPDISARQDQTNIGIDYARRGADMKKWFMDKWDLDEEGYNKVDFHTKDGSVRQYNVGGMTQGAYSHSTNPLKVVDKAGNDTGMELTGGEGVFDKPFMTKLQRMLASGEYKKAGKAVQSEMSTWKHK